MLVKYISNLSDTDNTGAFRVESGVIALGDTGEVTDDEYQKLASRFVLEVVGDELEDLSRSELDAIALDAGVDEPEKLPNKPAVIDAIREAEAH